MALIKCPECGKQISDKANACIHCGYPLNKGQSYVKYQSKYTTQRCKNCGNNFFGKIGENLCEDCKSKKMMEEVEQEAEKLIHPPFNPENIRFMSDYKWWL